ncbi:MAG: nucleotide exchange factor GrpE [Dehalococcoidales bacterium]|nr:nucleotide exchange factor GrpE [Dehalococcoidales bacterium]
MAGSDNTGENESVLGAGDEIDAIKKQLEEAKAKVEANLAGWQRSQADFINYKRRCEQEMSDMAQFASVSVIFSLLPILDDFERAFTSFQNGKDAVDDAWVEGMRLIERKLKATLEMQGLSAIKAKDEPFDPRMHEAVKEGKGKEGFVVQEIQKGYKLHDKVLRPAKVMVGTGEDLSDTE